MGLSSGLFLSIHGLQVKLELVTLDFVEGGKRKNPEEKPRSKDENQQQTQPTCNTRSGNRTRNQRGEADALTPDCTIPHTPRDFHSLNGLDLTRSPPSRRICYLCSWLSQVNCPFSTISFSLDLLPKNNARSVARIHSFM